MIWEELETGLAGLERDGLKRLRRTLEVPCGPLARVDGRDLISFCSNDYLGLANDPALIEAACAGARVWGVGSGASHLVSGHFSPHAELEEKLAAFTGFPRALLFSTGYMANLGIVVALAGRGDAVFADLANVAEKVAAAHGATVVAKIPDKPGNPVTYNDPALTERVVPSLRKAVGEGNVVAMDLNMGAEDFSFYAREVPGFFFFVGATPRGQDALRAPSNHSPAFFLDEDALKVGTRAMLQLVLDHQRGTGA